MDNNPAVTIPAAHRLRPPSSAKASSKPNDEQEPSPEKASIPSPNRPDITPSKNDQGWRRVVRNFSPSWFSITMGTGVVGILLHSIPWQAAWLNYLSIAFFILNTILFFGAFGISVLRYTIWPEIWVVMIQDPTNSLFLGTIPMGFATLVNLWVAHCVSRWGEWAVWVGWSFWVLDSILAVGITVTLGILLMSAHHQRSLDSITAAQLLPIAATIVSSALGSNIAQTLPPSHPTLTLATILASYIMWGMAVPLALSVLVIYYQRLALHKLPPREVIVSAFLPLGPLGYGGFVVLNLGKACMHTLPASTDHGSLDARTLYSMGFIVSLIMWSYGLLWFALALASIWKAHPIPFNMGWWGFTFPLGVYALSTILIGEELPSKFFRVLGTVFAVSVVLLWCLIAVRTARGAWTGKLFHAPCLANLKKGELVVEEEKGVVRENVK